MRAVLLVAAIGAGLLLPVEARADEATEARFHFHRGVKLFQKGKTHEALEQFLKSNQLVKNHNAVFNAAKCFELMGSENEAYALYSEYLQFDLTEQERSEGEKKLKEVKKNVATVSVQSSPEGANIFLDRKDLGSWGLTPRVIAVPAGSHEMILVLEDHHVLVVPFEAVIGEMKTISADLKPMTGTVHLVGPYKKVKVAVDGKPAGEMEIPHDLELPVGRHVIELQVEGMVPENRVVEVSEGKTSSMSFLLAPLPKPQGTLYIVSDPVAALVKMDGEDFDFTPIIRDAPVGAHHVTVEAAGMKTWQTDLLIEESDTLFLNVNLAPVSLPVAQKVGQVAVMIMGGLAIGAGIVTGSLSLTTKYKFYEEPSRGLRDKVHALSISTDVLLMAGGVSLLSGVVWYLVTRVPVKKESIGGITSQSNEGAEEVKLEPDGGETE